MRVLTAQGTTKYESSVAVLSKTDGGMAVPPTPFPPQKKKYIYIKINKFKIKLLLLCSKKFHPG